MRIGVPKETKTHEYRVGLIPSSVSELTRRGHSVLVERDAGVGAGFTDEEYDAAGAELCPSPDAPFGADLVVKVKEPQPDERKRLSAGQVLFTYLHLAPDPAQIEDLIKSRATCIAYETVTGPGGTLPLLTPMSQVAGRLAPQVGAHHLESAMGGRGVLLGGVPGVAKGQVVILGGGVSGSHAAAIALGMGASVTVIDRSAAVLQRLSDQFGAQIQTIASNEDAITRFAASADLLIGAVLTPGAAAPKLITHEIVRRMKPGSVIVDIAIDQGGCVETAKATTHANPTFIVDGVTHYCVANMPGAVPRTSTLALNAVTLPHVLALADKGWKQALKDDPHLRAGLNVHAGQVTCDPVAEAFGVKPLATERALAA